MDKYRIMLLWNHYSELTRPHFRVLVQNLVSTRNVVHKITLMNDTESAQQIIYRKGPKMRAVTQENVAEQMEAGEIETENSEWASPVVFESKKVGKLRFCNA